jgi:hypothetical protein
MVSIGFVSGYGLLTEICERLNKLLGTTGRGLLEQLIFSSTLCHGVNYSDKKTF